MYNNMPNKLKPTKTSNKITYACVFDPDFCLLLREIISTTPTQMQTMDWRQNLMYQQLIGSEEELIEKKERKKLKFLPQKLVEIF